jgi:hypothetical protein
VFWILGIEQGWKWFYSAKAEDKGDRVGGHQAGNEDHAAEAGVGV